MVYEVEQKFPVTDFLDLHERLLALGAAIGEAQIEVDTYFSHPSRDFGKTDEALRIRHKPVKNSLTYKGPKIDTTTKTRREIELSLPDGEETTWAWTSLLEAVGFNPVGQVRKNRRKAQVSWDGRDIECSLDEVQGLGSFCELELITEDAGLDAAKSSIASLAAKLGLNQSERRSYLELLFENNNVKK